MPLPVNPEIFKAYDVRGTYPDQINEQVARTEGLAWAHPYQPESLSQGAMEIVSTLEDMLAEITGMDAVTLQPAAGAHGEFVAPA